MAKLRLATGQPGRLLGGRDTARRIELKVKACDDFQDRPECCTVEPMKRHTQSQTLALWALLVLMAACNGSHPQTAEPLVLVDNSQGRAVIVTADQPSKTAQDAAGYLQHWIARMTTARLPIVRESDFRGQSVAVLVGPSKAAAAMGINVEQNEDLGDHYVIHTGPGRIALIGNDAGVLRGSIYAVYDLLQRLGCGWYGPDELWQVIPQADRLSVGELDIDERAAFAYRDIWLVRKLTRSFKDNGQAVKDAWRIGGKGGAFGHALGRVVPREKYLEDHPEYFGKHQPCLTNPAVIEIATEYCRRKIDEERDGGKVLLSFSPVDKGGFCQCEACRAVGNLSARLLNFSNHVARRLARTHPDSYLIGFYAYWYTHDPPEPMLRVEPGIMVMQVNEGNHVQPWDKPEPAYVVQAGRSNTREVTAFAGWGQTGAQRGIYEWWIPGEKKKVWRQIPWYSGETALRNLRYWHKAGVRYVTYETKNERHEGFPMRWPLYYVGARGMWDPSLTADEIMTEACDKLYGSAAKDMFGYYRTLEQAMTDSKEYAGNWGLPWPQRIYTPQVEAKATAFLDSASGATDDATVLARIAAERAIWDEARQVMAELRSTQPEPTYQVVVNGKVMPWPINKIDGANVRDLYGISGSTALFAIEDNKQKTRVEDYSVFDLSSKVRFVVEP